MCFLEDVFPGGLRWGEGWEDNAQDMADTLSIEPLAWAHLKEIGLLAIPKQEHPWCSTECARTLLVVSRRRRHSGPPRRSALPNRRTN